MASLLPTAFADLEHFVATWDLPGTDARYERRIRSPYPGLEDFYETMAVRIPAIRTYLDPKPLANLDEADRRLVRLVMAFTIVAPSVVCFQKPAVPDCGSIELFETPVEPRY